MSSTPKGLKRHLLEQAVSENVEVIRGDRPKHVNRARRMMVKVYKPLLVVALVSVLVLVYLFQQLNTFEKATDRSMVVDLSTYPPGTDFETVRKEAKERMLSRLTFPTPRPMSRSILPVRVRTVVVDAGHGGGNHGTASKTGMSEKTLTLDIATRLKLLLEQASFRVLMTREEDEELTLEDRIVMANRRSADIFVSIHLNWFHADQVQGVETFYLGPSDDETVERLAAKENVDSGYTLADVRGLLEDLYLDVRQEESRRLAESVQNQLYSAHHGSNPKVKNRGVKKAPFVVLMGTEMPAILTEVSYLSNFEEVERLNDPSYRQLIAQSLFDGIGAYADSLYKENKSGS